MDLRSWPQWSAGHDSYGIYMKTGSLDLQVLTPNPGVEGMVAFREHKAELNEERWRPGVWAALTHIATPGLGLWELGPAEPKRNTEDAARDMLIEWAYFPTAILTPPPVSIKVARLDVGHQVVYLGNDVWYGTVGTVTKRHRSEQPRTAPSIAIDTLQGERVEHMFEAVVPGGDYSRVEEILPGNVRWPVGAAVSWVMVTGTRRGQSVNGVVTEWRSDGVAAVLDRDTNVYHTATRHTLATGIAPHLRRRPARRR